MRIKVVVLALTIGCMGCSNKSEISELYCTPLATSIIHLNIAGSITDILYVEAWTTTNIPIGGSRSETLTITEPGDYFLNIEIDRATSCFLNLAERYNIIVFPNDTTHVQFNTTANGAEVNFTGHGANINKYYLEKKGALRYTDVRIPINTFITSDATYHSLIATIDSITNKEISFFEKYISDQELPSWFLNYERAEIEYMAEYFKTSLPHTNEILELFNDSLPLRFFSCLDSVDIENPDAVLSSHYLWFLDSYFTRDLPVDSFKNLGGLSRISLLQSHKLKQSELELSGLVKDIYHSYMFSSIVRYYSDSLAIDSLANEFELEDYKVLAKVAATKTKSNIKGLNLNKGDTIPNFYLVNPLDSLVSIREYQNEILYINFWATWCGPCIKNFPELNTLISQYKDDDRIKFINICIGSKKENWLSVTERHHLRGTNLFAEGNWNAKLESYFNIKGIPHYVIVNKNNVLHENFSDKAPVVQSKLDEILGNTGTAEKQL
jgi:thiol-disulfide isomerase/thioredoxin/uncharacterized lipoprotein NlpE involved in copper resistance